MEDYHPPFINVVINFQPKWLDLLGCIFIEPPLQQASQICLQIDGICESKVLIPPLLGNEVTRSGIISSLTHTLTVRLQCISGNTQPHHVRAFPSGSASELILMTYFKIHDEYPMGRSRTGDIG